MFGLETIRKNEKHCLVKNRIFFLVKNAFLFLKNSLFISILKYYGNQTNAKVTFKVSADCFKSLKNKMLKFAEA